MYKNLGLAIWLEAGFRPHRSTRLAYLQLFQEFRRELWPQWNGCE